MNGLRIVFMGTPDFAVESLKLLVNSGKNIVGVITVPDKAAGRGKKIQYSAVKKYALEQELNILQPANLKDENFISQLKSLKADLQIVVAFRMLPEKVWNMPELGTFNIHASLLPQYRGAAPINWAIINGDQISGVTSFFLTHEIDTGNIINQKTTPISNTDTAGDLHDRLMTLGAELALETVEAIETGNVTATPQQESLKDETTLKAAPKIFKEDCRIDWQRSSEDIYNHIRGLSPYPAAFMELEKAEEKDLYFKLFKVKLSDTHSLDIGEIKTDGKSFLEIGTKDKSLLIEELQLMGKRRMPVEDFLRGFKLTSEWKVKLS
ncbi:MAG: methionyl-tRNA formyltransferase [Bacteroidales bacterium]|nr:methionyl-tRNA formyltransferase [Bacteroidales bacterium]